MLRIYIGFDPDEAVAFNVLAHSIYARASQPVLISGIRLNQVPIWRDRDAKQSTEFAFSRFLVPYLCDYQGYALFMDCDMLMLADVNEVLQYASPRYAVSVCKHDYQPKLETKMLNHEQTKYVRKNWSSVMLFNNAACQKLTPEYVNAASGLDLHQFKWCQDDMIGELPLGWNHLIGEDNQSEDIKNLHWTNGGPWFAAWRDAPYSPQWREEYGRMVYSNPRDSYKRTVKAA